MTPSAASGGGTTTRRSAAWCSTSATAPVPLSSAVLRRDADIVLEGERPGDFASARHRPRRPPSRAPGIDLGLGHAVRSDDIACARARHRPHAARRRRPGVELRLRRPLPAAGARRRQPGIPHRRASFAVMAALTAILHREVTGARPAHRREHARGGQRHHRDGQLRLAGRPERRCSARPAATPVRSRSMPTQVRCADGRYVNTGFPPRSPREYKALLNWLDELGLREEAVEAPLLELGIERGGVAITEIGIDPLAREIYGAGRQVLCFIAERIPAHDYFLGGQTRGIPCAVIESPDEALESPHFAARGFPVEVEHDLLGCSVRYPGAPFVAPAAPWRISRRAPHIGEHNADILGGG